MKSLYNRLSVARQQLGIPFNIKISYLSEDKERLVLNDPQSLQ
jgi:hypothetical protein